MGQAQNSATPVPAAPAGAKPEINLTLPLKALRHRFSMARTGCLWSSV